MKRDWNYRRHHAKRKEAHAFDVIYHEWGFFSIDEARNQARRLRDHLAVCSCSMCRNPRRSGWLSNTEKRTIQERKADIAFQSDISIL